MAKYGSNSLVINFDNVGGTPTDMSNYVQTINSVEVEAIIEESTSFGDSWMESLATGIRKMSDVVLGGMFDDTATSGPDVVFNAVASGPSASTRTLAITWGGSKITSVETLIAKYARTSARNTITKYAVTLKPTGTVTEA